MISHGQQRLLTYPPLRQPSRSCQYSSISRTVALIRSLCLSATGFTAARPCLNLTGFRSLPCHLKPKNSTEDTYAAVQSQAEAFCFGVIIIRCLTCRQSLISTSNTLSYSQNISIRGTALPYVVQYPQNLGQPGLPSA